MVLLCASHPWLTANNRLLSTTGMMLNYSVTQLMKLNNYTTPSCISVIKQFGLLRRSRYIHRSCRRKFVFSRSAHTIPSLWSDVRIVASQTRHQSAVALRTSSTGVSMTTLLTERDRKRGVDFSLLRPIQRLTAPSNIKIELLNAQSLTNKSCLIHDHIQDKCLDLMCLTET